MLLAVEKNNELFMKNHEQIPIGARLVPEANANNARPIEQRRRCLERKPLRGSCMSRGRFTPHNDDRNRCDQRHQGQRAFRPARNVGNDNSS